MKSLSQQLKMKKRETGATWRSIYQELVKLGFTSPLCAFNKWLHAKHPLSETDIKAIKRFLDKKELKIQQIPTSTETFFEIPYLPSYPKAHTIGYPGIFINMSTHNRPQKGYQLIGIGISRSGNIFKLLSTNLKDAVVWEGNLPPTPEIVESFNSVNINTFINALKLLGWKII